MTLRYNTQNGGPAPESLTNAIFDRTKVLTSLNILPDFPDVDITTIGRTIIKRSEDAGV